MKIAIISDSHDNWVNIEKAIKFINKEKIRTIIHCGDVCSPAVLSGMAKIFKGDELHLVRGNVDGDIEGFKNVAKRYPKKLIYHGQTGKLEIDNLQLVFCHDPFVAKKIAHSQKYDFIFYGHSHKPWQEKVGKAELINPGTLAGLFFKATFAVLDTKTKKAKLILLEKIK
jgi:hypothetical protein